MSGLSDIKKSAELRQQLIELGIQDEDNDISNVTVTNPIKRGRPSIWTDEMVEFLKKEYPKYVGTVEDFVTYMNRELGKNLDVSKVLGKIATCRLIKKNHLARDTERRKWSVQEIEFLKKMMNGSNNKPLECQKFLNAKFNMNRSYRAVAHMMSNIKRTDFQDEKVLYEQDVPNFKDLKEFILETYPSFEGTLSEYVGYVHDNYDSKATYSSINGYIHRLNLRNERSRNIRTVNKIKQIEPQKNFFQRLLNNIGKKLLKL